MQKGNPFTVVAPIMSLGLLISFVPTVTATAEVNCKIKTCDLMACIGFTPE
jgi:hypothetical protein